MTTNCERSDDDITATPEFRAWFGDSRVVDADGNPLVMYHGTIAPDDGFDHFDRRAGKYATHATSINAIGSWFTDDPADAGAYAGAAGSKPVAGGHVMAVYLSIKQPFRIRSGDTMVAMWQVQSGGNERLQSGDPDAFRSTLIEQGYDGLVMEAASIDRFAAEGSQYWVAFHPEQIKSVNNRGTFDRENPNILFSQPAAPEVEDDDTQPAPRRSRTMRW